MTWYPRNLLIYMSVECPIRYIMLNSTDLACTLRGGAGPPDAPPSYKNNPFLTHNIFFIIKGVVLNCTAWVSTYLVMSATVRRVWV